MTVDCVAGHVEGGYSKHFPARSISDNDLIARDLPYPARGAIDPRADRRSCLKTSSCIQRSVAVQQPDGASAAGERRGRLRRARYAAQSTANQSPHPNSLLTGKLTRNFADSGLLQHF
jgi:hypothetical protein